MATGNRVEPSAPIAWNPKKNPTTPYLFSKFNPFGGHENEAPNDD